MPWCRLYLLINGLLKNELNANLAGQIVSSFSLIFENLLSNPQNKRKGSSAIRNVLGGQKRVNTRDVDMLPDS